MHPWNLPIKSNRIHRWPERGGCFRRVSNDFKSSGWIIIFQATFWAGLSHFKAERYSKFSKPFSSCWWKKSKNLLICNLSHYFQGIFNASRCFYSSFSSPSTVPPTVLFKDSYLSEWAQQLWPLLEDPECGSLKSSKNSASNNSNQSPTRTRRGHPSYKVVITPANPI